MSIVEVVRKTTTVVEVAHPGVQGPAGSGGGGGAVDSVNGRTGAVLLNSADVGLANVDNTSDASKPVSAAQAAADAAVLSSANATTAAHAGRTDNPHNVSAAQLGLGSVENKSSATIRGEITGGNVTTALGYTPENAAQKGAAGGYAPLDGTGKVASTYLPSYVDDVLEFANLAAFPVTGETGKMYVVLDTNKVYRWSGSAYVEISGSPGSTDAVPEGASNLYFTAARVLGTVLSGLSTATNAVITAADTVLSALGKLQKQISDNLTTLTNHTSNTSNPHATTAAQVGAVSTGAVTTSGLTMSTARLLGRNTASTGAIEEITLGTNLSFSGTTLNATGGGSPGGSSGAVQGNTSGAFAAIPGFTYDTTSGVLSVATGTITTSQPAATITQTWNAGGVAFTATKTNITNTASASTSLLDDKQVNGATVYSVRRDGYVSSGGGVLGAGGFKVGQYSSFDESTGLRAVLRFLNIPGIWIQNNANYISSNGLSFSDANNVVGSEGVNVRLTAPVSGRLDVVDTGTNLRDVRLRSLISSGGTVTLSNYTVATLPTAASNTHAIVAVTDGNASPTYRGAVTGGGSTKGVVYCDGSSWMWH